MVKIVLVLLAVAIVGVSGYVILSSEDEQPQSAVTSPSPSPSPQSTQSTGAGQYLDYSSDVIAQTAGTKILFFHAPWCPQCRALEADIKAKGVPSGVSIIKVDYDSNQQLRQKYGVTIQTTLVKVDDQGNLVEKYVAYDEPNLEAVKENLL